MTTLNKALILHAEDQRKTAEVFKSTLLLKGYSADLFGDFKEDSSEGVSAVLQETINSHQLIIVLLSQSLFRGCTLHNAINYAISQNVAILSAHRERELLLIPTWYSNLFQHIHSDYLLWSQLKEMA